MCFSGLSGGTHVFTDVDTFITERIYEEEKISEHH
jgi:hypothetical protein